MQTARLAIAILALALSLAALPARGDDAPRLVARGASWAPAVAEQPVAPAQALPPAAFLPLVVSPATPVAIRFGTGIEGGALVGQGTTFSYGITALHYQIEVAGQRGQPYREEWTVNGQRVPQLDSQGVVPLDAAILSNAILYSTGAPLPRGVYQIRFFIAGLPSGEAAATIQ